MRVNAINTFLNLVSLAITLRGTVNVSLSEIAFFAAGLVGFFAICPSKLSLWSKGFCSLVFGVMLAFFFDRLGSEAPKISSGIAQHRTAADVARLQDDLQQLSEKMERYTRDRLGSEAPKISSDIAQHITVVDVAEVKDLQQIDMPEGKKSRPETGEKPLNIGIDSHAGSGRTPPSIWDK